MEPTSGMGSILGGLAKVAMALRGAPFEVEATHLPSKPPTLCSECGRTINRGESERIRVVVTALTSIHHMRVRAAGVSRRIVGRRHTISVVPFGGHHGPHFRPEMLRQFGERRDLPATVTSDNPLSFHLMIPAELPAGIERGRKLRVWVGKPTFWRARVSEAITLPHPTAQESPAPELCIWCRHEAALSSKKSRTQPAPPSH